MSLPVKKGQVLTPGTLVVSVAAPDQLEVKADILSDDLGEVRLGQRVVITAPILGQSSISGEVRKIYPQAEEETSALGVVQRRVPVIVRLDSGSVLKPGYEVQASIETASRDNVLVVPRESVRTVGEGQKEVMAVVGGRVRHLPVEIGITGSDTVEITGGLQAGDRLITDGSQDLAEGARVKEAAAK
jgi:HlyD family secretion protein